MKFKIITTCFLLLFSFLLFPQDQSRFNAGATFNIGFPTGSFTDIAQTGIGGSALGEYAFSESVTAILSVSYQNFPGKGEGTAFQGEIYDFSVNSIPILAGARYYFSKDFFGLAEAGVNFLRITADIYDLYSEERVSTDYKAKYGGGIGAGYRYRLAEQSVFELSGVYQIYQDEFNSFSLRIGVLVLLDTI